MPAHQLPAQVRHLRSGVLPQSLFVLALLLAVVGGATLIGPSAGNRPGVPASAQRSRADARPGALSWEPDHRATQDTTGAAQNETYIAANPLDPNNAIVVCKDYRNAAVRDYIDATTDGGFTWHEQPFPYPGPAAPNYSDPAVFFRNDGRAYITWMGFLEFGSGGLYISWSDDKGLTWSPATQVTPPTGHYDDKEWLTFDQTGGPRDGTLYMAWVRFGNSEIFSASSTDGGATWSDPVQASDLQWAINDQDPRPLVLRDGSLIITYINDISPGDPGIVILTRSTDGGNTFSHGQPLFVVQQPPYTLPGDHWRLFTFPSLALDPVRGWLNLVWNDYRHGSTNGADILLSRSTDEGRTWSDPLRLNDDPEGVVRDQWFPEIIASPDGRLTAMWLDRRDDPDNRLYHAYSRASIDGGLTWLPSVRVSSAPSDPNTNIPPGSDGIGDYIGISAGPDVVWGSWIDVRNGDQDIYAAREWTGPQPTATPTQTKEVTPTGTVTPASTATPCPLPFSDVPPDAYFYEPVRYLFCRGVVSGYPDSTFRPYNSTTRGQLVKIVVLAEGWQVAEPPDATFEDVPPGSTFYGYVETAVEHGIIVGYPCGGPGEPCDPQNHPYFRPNGTVTRAQTAKIVVLAAGWPLEDPLLPTFTDVPYGSTFYPYVETAAYRGVLSGYACGGPNEPCDPQNRPYFRPFNNSTRGQNAKIVYNAVRNP